MFLSALTIPGGRIANRLGSDIRQSVTQIVNRRNFKRLLDLDDAILDDIGVTRADVLIASRLPLQKNAALELRRMSLKSRRQCK